MNDKEKNTRTSEFTRHFYTGDSDYCVLYVVICDDNYLFIYLLILLFLVIL